MLEHPEIGWALRTGYPSWAQDDIDDDDDDDRYYEESRDRDFYDW